jgi:hypothetical protein
VLADRKAKGEPIDYIAYHATHVWDWRELPSLSWGSSIGAYNPEVARQSVEDAFGRPVLAQPGRQTLVTDSPLHIAKRAS